MTRFEELTDIINSNKKGNKKLPSEHDVRNSSVAEYEEDSELQVAGLGDSGGGNPIIMCPDYLTKDGEIDMTDADLITQLDMHHRAKPHPQGWTESWD